MSKCPFWSTTVEKVACNKECPINTIQGSEKPCVFSEYLVEKKFVFKDIIEDYEYDDSKIMNLRGYIEEEVF